MAVVNPPGHLQNVLDPADRFRWGFGGLFNEGILSYNGANDLQVTQSAALGMTVDVKMGGAFVFGDDVLGQGMYTVFNNALLTVSGFTADATNPKIDIVVFHVKDAFAGQAGDTSLIEVIEGAASGTPSAPALPSTALLLATVSVPASTTQITNGLITDNRVRAYQKGFHGVRAFASGPQTLSNGNDIAINLDSETFKSDGGYHSNSTNNSRITPPVAGYHLLIGQIQYSANPGGSRRARFRMNGATYISATIHSDEADVGTGVAETLVTVTPWFFNGTTDYVQLMGYQNISAGSLATNGGADSTFLSAHLIGTA